MVVHTAEPGLLQRPYFIGFLSLLRRLAEREGFSPHPQDLTNTNIGFCGRILPRDAVHGRDKPRTASRSNFYGRVTFGVTWGLPSHVGPGQGRQRRRDPARRCIREHGVDFGRSSFPSAPGKMIVQEFAFSAGKQFQ